MVRKPERPDRLRLPLFATVSALLLLFPIHDLLVAGPNIGGYGGVDYRLYVEATTRWIHGGPFFEPSQLAGPYTVAPGDILYPPTALLLFIPFTVLPGFLWWAIPAAAVGWMLWRLRPDPIAWPFLALCMAWPPTMVKVATGNPVIWAVAALALGAVYRWPSVFVLVKPSLFPFALFGSWTRTWWVTLGVFVALSAVFGTLWIDWIKTLLNSRGGGLAYSIQEIPMLLFPVIAFLGRTRRQT